MRARFVGQPFDENGNLYDFLTGSLARAELRHLTVVTAWAKRSGLARIATGLEEFRKRGGESRIIVGIDEGGATEQGLRLARDLFDKTYVFHDPGRRTFHPKIYVATGDLAAEAFIGSNNMTAGGLYFNYEGASYIEVDRNDNEDERYLSEIEAYVDALLGEDELCLELDDDLFDHLIENRNRYRIRDEDDSHRTRNERDTEEPEDTDQHAEAELAEDRFGRPSRGRRPDPNPASARSSSGPTSAGGASGATSPATGASGAVSGGITPPPGGPATPASVWKRWTKKLGNIDAQQSGGSPDWHASNTLTLVAAGHPVDTQTYFRDNLFANLNWIPTISRGGRQREVATVTCEVFVNGSSIGPHQFELRHTPDYNSNQSNRATELVWGDLGAYLKANSHAGDYVSIERLADGSYRLHLAPAPTGPFLD